MWPLFEASVGILPEDPSTDLLGPNHGNDSQCTKKAESASCWYVDS